MIADRVRRKTSFHLGVIITLEQGCGEFLELDAIEGLVLCDVGVKRVKILGKGTELDFMRYNIIEPIKHERKERYVLACERCRRLVSQFLQPLIPPLLYDCRNRVWAYAVYQGARALGAYIK